MQKYEEVKNLPMKDVLLRKAAGYDFYNTRKLEFGVCFINFFQSTQVRSWNPYFFQVHLWLLHNMIF